MQPRKRPHCTVWHATFVSALLITVFYACGCGSTGGNATGGVIVSTGSPSSATQSIVLEGVNDSVATPVPAVTLTPGTSVIPVRVSYGNEAKAASASSPRLDILASNPEVLTARVDSGNLIVTANPGRSSVHLSVPSLGIERYVGIIVRDPDGGIPGLPLQEDYVDASKTAPDKATPHGAVPLTGANHLALGVQSVAEDGMYQLLTNGGQMPDMRCRYLNNGFSNGWYAWTPKGGLVTNYVNASVQYGMLPVFVYYQLPGGPENSPGGESAAEDRANIQKSEFIASYFRDLYHALKRIGASKTPVAIILEPDFLAYMMQNYSDASFTTRPADIPAAGLPGATTVMEEDADGNPTTTPILATGEVPGATGNNVKSLVLTINYMVAKYAPNAEFGWLVNTWGSGGYGRVGLPANGFLHHTDVAMQTLGSNPTDPTALASFHAARSAIASESDIIAQWYLDAGCMSNRATFVAVDKYGIDGADPATTVTGAGGDCDPNGTGYTNPPTSVNFWNAVQWNNYLTFIKQLHTRTGAAVLIWQLPTGHLNGTTSTCVGPVNGGWPDVTAGATFPDLTDTAFKTSTATALNGCWEETGPPFFLGDTIKSVADPGHFQTAQQRYAWFGQSDPDYPSDVTVDPSTLTVTWAEHMTRARSYGVIGIIFGPGLDNATQNVGWRERWGGGPPTDGWWYMSRLQTYLANPIALP